MADDTVDKHVKANVELPLDREEYTLRKRLPRRLPKRKNDVYVTRKTDFKAQLARCQKLLDSGYNEIYVHALGAAINRGLNMALQLKERGLGTIDLAVHTSSVELVDDLEPTDDQHDQKTQTRMNSAIHIKVYRPELPVSVGTEGN
ncbi:PREDICTED: ribonuclease P protein subunit p20-like [Priapulus caudatus]|uniref:Ribonuclease P protein subunit p20 n=1 Tax=Priapulus caudatus TaxID=37621 RepID=A0ABM1EI76_PRICU|nr:PREDICTED: ribonuclease P protein subunit p20-like [Priapulus caudatus]